MTTEELKLIWGTDLFDAFSAHIDDNGWLTSNWGNILEDEFSDWDKNNKATGIKSGLYNRMYNIDYEESEDGKMIRRTDEIDVKKLEDVRELLGRDLTESECLLFKLKHDSTIGYFATTTLGKLKWVGAVETWRP